jgi:hypothetical protein
MTHQNPWTIFAAKMPMLADYVEPVARHDVENQVWEMRFLSGETELRLLISSGPSTYHVIISSFMLCLGGRVHCKAQGNLCDRVYLLKVFEVLEQYFMVQPVVIANTEDKGG